MEKREVVGTTPGGAGVTRLQGDLLPPNQEIRLLRWLELRLIPTYCWSDAHTGQGAMAPQQD